MPRKPGDNELWGRGGLLRPLVSDEDREKFLDEVRQHVGEVGAERLQELLDKRSEKSKEA